MLTLLAVGAAQARKEFTAMQFNIWQEGTMVAGGFEAIADEIARHDPDVVMLSETRNYHNTRFCDRIVAALAKRGKTYHSFYSYDSGLLSKTEITDSATIYPVHDDHGTIYRIITTLGGHEAAVYTAHLDYQNGANLEPRGYSGVTWRKMDKPITNPDTLLYHNNKSFRPAEIRVFMEDAAEQAANGRIVILGGDFNEPSHLDWTEATAQMAAHNGVVLKWPTTQLLENGGFVDAYRELHPNPATHPGYTFPCHNEAVEPLKITWAPESDERERIDYIVYYPFRGLRAAEASLVGPRRSVAYGKPIEETSQDAFIEPMGVWPTDHKAVLVKFVIED